MKNINKKLIITFCCSLFVIFSLFPQSQDIIVLPDISTELDSEEFIFEEAAIPDFKVEPIKVSKNTPEVKVEVPLEPEPIIEEVAIVDVPEVTINEDFYSDTLEPEKKLIFGVGGSVGFSTHGFDISPKIQVYYKGEGFYAGGDLNLSFGASKTGLVKPSDKEKLYFAALEGLHGEIGFELPKDFVLVAKTGIDLYQCNGFDFSIPFVLNVTYNGFEPFSVFAELGQKTFRPFVSSFYGAVGGNVTFGLFEDLLVLEFGKKIGISNTLSFSTKPEKYKINFTVEYFIKDSPYFSIGGIYKF